MGGFPNGSGVDIYQRKLAEPLSQALGVPVVVDNRSGAGGNIASDHVAKAKPDGYTFLFGTAGTHAINATLYRSLPFDPVKDSTPIAHLGDVPNVLTVSAERRPGLATCQDVIRTAKAQPGKLNYASTGNGASTHRPARSSRRWRGWTSCMCPSAGSPARRRRCCPAMWTCSSTSPAPPSATSSRGR
ncbi:Bug family tripartite tricarboxylate transporter substrate binding protein [Teichococcus aestuarii]|uniref:Bug family tripartite tricarboxylate transporter substrate binding protein n=1 Tax=Teichococcus aestuarii TaxID=568898 RepID=UPI003623206C